MDTQPRTVDPLAAVLAVLDAGDALAAAARLADACRGRRRVVGRSAGLPLPDAFAAAADDWQAAADDAELCLPLLADAIRLRMPAPPAGPLAPAAAPALGRAA